MDVMKHVGAVIIDQKLQGYRSIGADGARRGKPVWRNARDDAGKLQVQIAPEADKRGPGDFGVIGEGNPGIWIVGGAGVVAIERGTYDAVVIVHGGIHQMPQFLLDGPSAAFAFFTRNFGWNVEEDGCFRKNKLVECQGLAPVFQCRPEFRERRFQTVADADAESVFSHGEGVAHVGAFRDGGAVAFADQAL